MLWIYLMYSPPLRSLFLSHSYCSIFDSLVAGCIPVLFSKASLSQYSWHVSEAEMDSISVYIPLYEMVRDGKNFMDVLKVSTMNRPCGMCVQCLMHGVRLLCITRSYF